MLKCVCLQNLWRCAAFSGFYWDHFWTISSQISMSALSVMMTVITEMMSSVNYFVCATFCCWDMKKISH